MDCVAYPRGGARGCFGHMVHDEWQRRKFSHEGELEWEKRKLKQTTVINNLISELVLTWKVSVDGRLGSAHTAEIWVDICRPVSASITCASGESTTTLMTEVRSCSVGLKMINDLKQNPIINRSDCDWSQPLTGVTDIYTPRGPPFFSHSFYYFLKTLFLLYCFVFWHKDDRLKSEL